MSEFFLELFSEEIPSSLQKSLREDLLNNFVKIFKKNQFHLKKAHHFQHPID
jgi:glycyl-tRNA synthetase beta chain